MGGNDISVYAYSLETVVAEKLETLFSRSILNGRMKYYYDIYLIYQINKDRVSIEANENIRHLWSNYSTKHSFAEEIKFDDVFTCIRDLCREIGLI